VCGPIAIAGAGRLGRVPGGPPRTLFGGSACAIAAHCHQASAPTTVVYTHVDVAAATWRNPVWRRLGQDRHSYEYDHLCMGVPALYARQQTRQQNLQPVPRSPPFWRTARKRRRRRRRKEQPRDPTGWYVAEAGGPCSMLLRESARIMGRWRHRRRTEALARIGCAP
jgi:hypothetical protein